MKTKALSLTTPLVQAFIDGPRFGHYPKRETRRLEKSDKPPWKIGEVLWIREPAEIFRLIYEDSKEPKCVRLWYPADEEPSAWIDWPKRLKWRPNDTVNERCPNGVFREGARHFVRVTHVWKHLLNNMNGFDATNEGIPLRPFDPGLTHAGHCELLIQDFAEMWDGIYPCRSFLTNPIVWACRFEPCERPKEETAS